MAYQKKENNREYLRLNEDLRSGQLSPVYLLYGEENYLKRSYLSAFRKQFSDGDGMNCTVFEEAPAAEALIEALDTMPFFADRRLVVVKGSGWFKKNPPDRLITYLSGGQMPETSHLLFLESEADKRNRLYKEVSAHGFACELGIQDEKQLSGWAARCLSAAGKKIRSQTMHRLLLRTGSSMDNIASELEKLIAYLGTREIVEDEDIDTICTQNAENRVFDMITELSLGNMNRAMRYYKDLLALEEEPMRILALMRRNFNQLLLVKDAVKRGMSRQELPAFAGVSPWVADKLLNQARQYTEASLERCLRRCLQYETAIKNGDMQDSIALELLLVAL